jgi:Archaea-specific RecJ-like exonuclease, contains DnaJ-type Zn finger domain
MGYKQVIRCKSCGKIFSKNVPFTCPKCGVILKWQSVVFGNLLTNKSENVIAKRKLFKWIVKESKPEPEEN